MKKTAAILAFGAILGISAISSATVPESQLALGGVSYGATVAEVEAAYGQPARAKTSQKHYGEKTKYKYANGLEITFVDGIVRKAEAEWPSELATVGGVKAGMNVSVLNEVYGAPDYIHKDEYVYFLEGDNTVGLTFKAKQGVIEEIELGRLDD